MPGKLKIEGYEQGGLVEPMDAPYEWDARTLAYLEEERKKREQAVSEAQARADAAKSSYFQRAGAGIGAAIAGRDPTAAIEGLRAADRQLQENVTGAQAKAAAEQAKLQQYLMGLKDKRELEREKIAGRIKEAQIRAEDRATEARLRREDRQATRAIEADRRAEARQDRLDKQTEDEVRQAEKRLAPAIDIQNTLANVEDKLGFALDAAEVKDGKVIVGGQAQDLPGVSIPGLGRRTFYDSDARQLSSAVSKVFNVELKDRSGAAVTTPELERLKNEFASGRFNTEAEMVQALKDYKRLAAQALRNAEAAFRPEVLERYAQRGGQTSQQLGFAANNERPAFESDVLAYAQKHGITPEQANQIKILKTQKSQTAKKK